jgi:mannose-6-phosphate isomerase-like protein (cupin superfamily)
MTLLNTSLRRKYAERKKLVRDAFTMDASGSPTNGPIPLHRLVELMKVRSAGSSFLSSLYFAGAEGDHPYFLKTDSLAIGIAVLPEDNPKASRSKQHPHQTEVLFVLDGRINLEREIAGRTVTKILRRGDVEMISPGQCHRVTSVDNENACYLFAKSNPAQEPREEDCTLRSMEETPSI